MSLLMPSRREDLVNQVTGLLSLDDIDKATLQKCAQHYGEKSVLKNIYYRVCNGFLALIGKSEWQISRNIIKEKVFSRINKEVLRPVGKDGDVAKESKQIAEKIVKLLVQDQCDRSEVPLIFQPLKNHEVKLTDLFENLGSGKAKIKSKRSS